MFYQKLYSEEYHLTYAISGGCAILLSYDGDAAHLSLPDRLEDCLVTVIESYAFSGKGMTYLSLPAGLKKIEHHGFSECKGLTHIEFPASLEIIGNYAFYNCWEISEVHFGPYVRSIGFGAFMNCDKLTRIVQDRIEGCPLSLGSLLDELQHQIHLEMHHMREDGSYETGMVTFTEYQTEIIADAAAIASICKQFISEYTGSGRSLRFCLDTNGIDYRKYDGMFIKVLYMDSFDIAVRIAVERLLYPRELGSEARTAYMDYLTEHAGEALQKFVREDDMPALSLLLDHALPDQAQTDAAIDLAMSLDKGAVTPLLMDYRHRHFAMQEDSFDL